ncbi:hypothetical protein [Catalinimonas niigatensis]|uniref:hypothetical protein n=1 Tax=Catalinimonas niigatensis TaxID=1397264 RepID=UPI002665011B|nr:hypothetical protein [Catalinimonas niigatensis]WPP49079.1 hypothetical protein PZB72_20640 [Catalinimonas niigatensis]
MIREIYYGIVLFFAFAFGLLTCVGVAVDDMCGNEIIQEIPSPNRKLKAVIFTRNCGATTGYSTHISLLPVTQKLLNTGGNILITSGNGNAPSWEFGGVPVEVVWISKYSLKISYPGEAKTFTKETNFDEVAIVYETYDSTPPSSSYLEKKSDDKMLH